MPCPPSLSLPQPLSKELVGFLKNKSDFVKNTSLVARSGEVQSEVSKHHTGVQSFS